LQNCKVFTPGTKNYEIKLFYEGKEAGNLTFDTTFTQ
jgi:hypothetical protein